MVEELITRHTQQRIVFSKSRQMARMTTVVDTFTLLYMIQAANLDCSSTASTLSFYLSDILSDIVACKVILNRPQDALRLLQEPNNEDARARKAADTRLKHARRLLELWLKLAKKAFLRLHAPAAEAEKRAETVHNAWQSGLYNLLKRPGAAGDSAAPAPLAALTMAGINEACRTDILGLLNAAIPTAGIIPSPEVPASVQVAAEHHQGHAMAVEESQEDGSWSDAALALVEAAEAQARSLPAWAAANEKAAQAWLRGQFVRDFFCDIVFTGV